MTKGGTPKTTANEISRTLPSSPREKRPFTGAHFADWASGLTLDNGKPWLVEPFRPHSSATSPPASRGAG